jgi:hypothetical protein
MAIRQVGEEKISERFSMPVEEIAAWVFDTKRLEGLIGRFRERIGSVN